MVTTELDSKHYPKAKLAQLYQRRKASNGSEFQAPENHLEDGDDFCENAPDGAKGNLGANACVQLAANLNVAIRTAI